MDAKEWIKAQMGVWKVYYEGRDIRDKEVHPAVMPIALAKKAVELFTHKGELVVDPFNGIGTTLLACQDLERNAVGFDINDKYREITEQRLAQQRLSHTRTKQSPSLMTRETYPNTWNRNPLAYFSYRHPTRTS